MGYTLVRWFPCAGRVTGRAHEALQRPCEDWVGVSSAGGVHAVALADGAGSAIHGRAGARLLVRAVLGRIADLVEPLLTERALEIARAELGLFLTRLARVAGRRRRDTRDFAATLLFVAVKGQRFVAGHVGDGVIACQRAGGAEVLSSPASGEHLNETIFVTSAEAATSLRLHCGTTSDCTAFTVMSDGAAESLYSRRDQSLARAVSVIWSWFESHPPEVVDPSLHGVLDKLRSRTIDDCSLGVLKRVELDLERLRALPPAYQMRFLGVRSTVGLRNRLAVLVLLEPRCPVDLSALAVRTGLSRATVRQHLRRLGPLLSPPAPFPTSGNPPGDTRGGE